MCTSAGAVRAFDFFLILATSQFKCFSKFFNPWMCLGQRVWWREKRRQNITYHSFATLVTTLHEKKTKITTSVDCARSDDQQPRARIPSGLRIE